MSASSCSSETERQRHSRDIILSSPAQLSAALPRLGPAAATDDGYGSTPYTVVPVRRRAAPTPRRPRRSSCNAARATLATHCFGFATRIAAGGYLSRQLRQQPRARSYGCSRQRPLGGRDLKLCRMPRGDGLLRCEVGGERGGQETPGELRNARVPSSATGNGIEGSSGLTILYSTVLPSVLFPGPNSPAEPGTVH